MNNQPAKYSNKKGEEQEKEEKEEGEYYFDNPHDLKLFFVFSPLRSGLSSNAITMISEKAFANLRSLLIL